MVHFIIIIIIIIIINNNIHIRHFTAASLVLERVEVLLTKHFLFPVLPKTVWLYGMYEVLLLSALEYV